MEAMPAIVRLERQQCIDFAKSLNRFVGEKLQEKRGSL
jgi:hypothetical protein